VLNANSNLTLLPVCFLLPLCEGMIARRADVNTAAKAAGLECPSSDNLRQMAV